jgi:hypothetical protein
MLKNASTIFLAITLIAAMAIGLQVEPADALQKSQGTYNQKYGSDTKNIVCGDRLCSESDVPKQSSQTTTESTIPMKSKPTINTCDVTSIQIESDCLTFKINGATVKDSYYDKTTDSTTIQINAANNGQITITDAHSLLRSSFILVDGEEWNDVNVDKTGLTIEFFAGTETIEIFGN